MPSGTSEIIDLLKQCDTTLESCHKANQSKTKVIKAMDESNAMLSERVIELEGRSDNKWLWFVLGIAGGSLAVSILR